MSLADVCVRVLHTITMKLAVYLSIHQVYTSVRAGSTSEILELFYKRQLCCLRAVPKSSFALEGPLTLNALVVVTTYLVLVFSASYQFQPSHGSQKNVLRSTANTVL
jgi:hypothetical protein